VLVFGSDIEALFLRRGLGTASRLAEMRESPLSFPINRLRKE